MSTNTSSPKKSVFDGSKMWFLFAAISAVVVSVLMLIIMLSITQKDYMWVLKEDVDARVQLTEENLEQIPVAKGGVPPTALDIEDIRGRYANIPLQRGDIITLTNSSRNATTLHAGLPTDFVVASFTASPQSAVAGNIRRGDYIDVILVTEDSNITGGVGTTGASYVLQRVLVLDAVSSLESSQDTAVGRSGAYSPPGNRAGVPTTYVVGLSQTDALKLAVASEYTLNVVLSSEDSANNGIINFYPEVIYADGIWGTMLPDSGEGTDPINWLSTPGKSTGGNQPVEPGTGSNDSGTNIDPEQPVEDEAVVEEEEELVNQ